MGGGEDHIVVDQGRRTAGDLVGDHHEHADALGGGLDQALDRIGVIEAGHLVPVGVAVDAQPAVAEGRLGIPRSLEEVDDGAPAGAIDAGAAQTVAVVEILQGGAGALDWPAPHLFTRNQGEDVVVPRRPGDAHPVAGRIRACGEPQDQEPGRRIGIVVDHRSAAGADRKGWDVLAVPRLWVARTAPAKDSRTIAARRVAAFLITAP